MIRASQIYATAGLTGQRQQNGRKNAVGREGQQGVDLKRVYVVGTHDTKGEELGYLADLIEAEGQPVVRVDVGTRLPGDF